MKILRNTGMAVVVIVCAALVGVAVVRAPVLLALATVVAVWLVVSTPVRLTLLIAALFLPFTVGDVGGIPDLLVAEILVPLAAITGLITRVRARMPLLPREGIPYAAAIGVYAAVSLGHVVIGPDGLAALVDVAGPATGLRAYYALLLGPVTFLAVTWLGFGSDLSKNGLAVMRALVWTAAAAAMLRVFSYYAGLETPFLAGTFRYGVLSRVLAGGVADRIGGLAEAAAMGLAGVFGLWFGRERGSWLVLPGTVLITGVLLSGGRAPVLGILVAMGVVAFALSPGRRARVAILGAASAILGTAGVVLAGFSRQFERLLAFSGGLQSQDPRRYLAIRYQMQEFFAHPVFGKGIGVSTVPISDVFVAEQVSRGGHATYTSVLANQGIVGLATLLVVAAGPALQAFMEVRKVSKMSAAPAGLRAVLVFVLFFGAFKLVQFVVGGNGYSDATPYAYAGLLVVYLLDLQRSAE